MNHKSTKNREKLIEMDKALRKSILMTPKSMKKKEHDTNTKERHTIRKKARARKDSEKQNLYSLFFSTNIKSHIYQREEEARERARQQEKEEALERAKQEFFEQEEAYRLALEQEYSDYDDYIEYHEHRTSFDPWESYHYCCQCGARV